MTVPAKSATGTGAFSIDHLEVYAVTLAPGAIAPPNRDLLKPEHVDRDDPGRAAARSGGGRSRTRRRRARGPATR